MKHKHTIEEFTTIVKNSRSIRQALKALGLNASGNAYRIFEKRIKDNNIDTSHFLGMGWSKGTIGLVEAKSKIPLSEILEGLHPNYQSHKLRIRLFSENIFEKKMSEM